MPSRDEYLRWITTRQRILYFELMDAFPDWSSDDLAVIAQEMAEGEALGRLIDGADDWDSASVMR